MLVETCVNGNTMFVPPKDVMFHTQFRNPKKTVSTPQVQNFEPGPSFQPSFNHPFHQTQLPFNHPTTSPRTKNRLLLPSNHISPAETNRTRNHSTDQIQRTQNARIPSLDRFNKGNKISSKVEGGMFFLMGIWGVRDFS